MTVIDKILDILPASIILLCSKYYFFCIVNTTMRFNNNALWRFYTPNY